MEEKEQPLIYCRKCQGHYKENRFNKAFDNGAIDSNGKMSVCKKCLQVIYNEIFEETQSVESTIHKMCQSLNVRYTNEAMDATRKHIDSLSLKNQNVKAIFSIYLMKLVATNPSMDKSAEMDMTYNDIGTIYVDRLFDAKDVPVPEEALARWGKDIPREDILFLENEYANFKKTHKADTYAEVTLLKQVCRTVLALKKAESGETVDYKEVTSITKTLQDLMNSLAVSPKLTQAQSQDDECFGLWIKDIEMYEPAQWVKTDPRGDMFRDIGNPDSYFKDYVVRPLKNFILQSRDFNIEDSVEVNLESNS